MNQSDGSLQIDLDALSRGLQQVTAETLIATGMPVLLAWVYIRELASRAGTRHGLASPGEVADCARAIWDDLLNRPTRMRKHGLRGRTLRCARRALRRYAHVTLRSFWWRVLPPEQAMAVNLAYERANPLRAEALAPAAPAFASPAPAPVSAAPAPVTADIRGQPLCVPAPERVGPVINLPGALPVGAVVEADVSPAAPVSDVPAYPLSVEAPLDPGLAGLLPDMSAPPIPAARPASSPMPDWSNPPQPPVPFGRIDPMEPTPAPHTLLDWVLAIPVLSAVCAVLALIGLAGFAVAYSGGMLVEILAHQWGWQLGLAALMALAVVGAWRRRGARQEM